MSSLGYLNDYSSRIFLAPVPIGLLEGKLGWCLWLGLLYSGEALFVIWLTGSIV